MPSHRPRLGSGFEPLETRDLPTATPYADLRQDFRDLYETAIVRVDADHNTAGVSVSGASVITGVIADKYDFDNPGDTIQVPHASTINFSDAAFSVSVMASVQPNAALDNPYFTLFEKGNMNGNQASVGAAIRPGLDGGADVMDIWLQGGSGYAQRIYVRKPLGVNVTQMNTYTITYDGSGSASGVQLYVNGSAAGSNLYTQSNLNSSPSSSQPMTIHTGFGNDQQKELLGTMDAAVFFNRVLTSAERTLLVERPLAPVEEPPLTLSEAEAALVAAQEALANAMSAYMNGLTPRMEVVAIDGANITLSVTLPPTAVADIDLQYGLLDRKVYAPDGTLDSRVTMTLDTTNTWRRTHDGDYEVALVSGGQVRDIIGLHWNAGSQSLSTLGWSGDRTFHEKALSPAVLSAQQAVADAEAALIGLGGDVPEEDDPILALDESETRTALGTTLLDLRVAERPIPDLNAEIAAIPADLTHFQQMLASYPTNDPAYVETRQILQSRIDGLHARQIIAPILLDDAETAANAAEAHIDALTDHLTSFVSAGEADEFIAWVQASYAQADSELDDTEFALWCEAFETNGFTEMPSTLPPVVPWESGAPYDLYAIQNGLGVQRVRGGHTLGTGLVGIGNSPHQLYPDHTFNRVDLVVTQGDATIQGVKYINETGMHTLPSAYFSIIGGKTVIIKPNAPQNIVLQTVGNGAFFIAQTSEPTFGQLRPPEEVTPSIEVLQVRSVYGAEGWQAYPSTVSTVNQRAFAGQTVNMLFGLSNDGIVGGDVTVRVKVGDGSASDAVVATYQRHLNAQEHAALSVNVTLPTDHAFVYLEVVKPDGETVRHGRFIQKPRDPTPEPRPLAEIPAGIPDDIRSQLEAHDTYSAYNWNLRVIAIAHASEGATALRAALQSYSDAWEHLSGGNPVQVMEAEQTMVDFGLSDEDREEAEVGGDIEESNIVSTAQLFREVQDWYDPNVTLPAAAHGRTDTIVGKIYLGMMQKIWHASSAEETDLIAEKIQAVTDIPAWRVKNAIAMDAATFVANMEALFALAQYEHILDQETVNIFPLFANADTDAQDYHGGAVRVRFDIDTSGKTLSYVEAYTEFEGVVRLAATTRSGTFLKVPVTALVPTTGTETRVITLKAHFTDGTTQSTTTNPFTVDYRDVWNGSSVGPTLALSTGNSASENAVLTQIARNFFLTNRTDLRWSIGSKAHTGDSFDAVDLNRGSGDNDLGDRVNAVANGVIADIGLDYGSIYIDHAMANGQAVDWQSKYLHMAIYAKGEQRLVEVIINGSARYEMRDIYVVRNLKSSVADIEIWEGKEIRAGEQIGFVAGRGLDDSIRKDDAFSPHMHFAAVIAGEDVDMRLFMEHMDIQAAAEKVGGRTGIDSIEWDPTLGAWYFSEFNLILDRSPQEATGEHQARWIANHADPSQRQAVTWTSVSNVVRQDGSIGNVLMWVKTSSLNSPIQYWDSVQRIFINIPFA